ncbi:MAG: DAK2 domain-containing protein [Acidimicrobiales bacterium]
MAALEALEGPHLQAVVEAFARLLRSHEARLNALNVFPVADSDTGSNLAATAEAAVAALARRSGGAVADTAAALAGAVFDHARGNSGTILAQILWGFAQEAAGRRRLDAAGLAEALAAGARAAPLALAAPVEGTMLTVARELADAALAAAGSGAGGAAGAGAPAPLLDVLDAARFAAYDSLARTPELLPALAAAGVVDSGGAGYALLADAFLEVVDGRRPPTPAGAAGAAGASSGAAPAVYEVMFQLRATLDQAAVKAALGSVGDSVTVAGAGRRWICHVHTTDIGAALEAGLRFAPPTAVRVEALVER